MAETVEGIEELMDTVLELQAEPSIKRRLLRVLGQVASMLEAPPKVQLPTYRGGDFAHVNTDLGLQSPVTATTTTERAFLPPERVTGNPLVAQK